MPPPTAPKHGRREDTHKPAGKVAPPFHRAYTASLEAKLRHPQTPREYLREFRSACDAEAPERSHGSGVEAERVTGSQVATAIVRGLPLPAPEGGPSSMGGPRWTHEFRAYLDAGGSPFSTYIDDHGEEQWAYPLRSSIKRMEQSRSGVDRSAAEFLYLLRRCRNGPREAWAIQCGKVGVIAAGNVLEVADTWANECLRRWYGYFMERPRGKPLT
jgi:hypothetical protein